MKNLFTLVIICTILVISIIIGESVNNTSISQNRSDLVSIPHIGSIEVLNGCGISGAAKRVADYLRKSNFDVKNVDNAENWNYPFTLIVSRKTDTTIANQIARALDTDKIVIIRNNDNLYDVTIYIGPDFGERIQ
jgi:polyisoprenyl-teichoic acid--peptidoglycan teichoic acid transferase